MLGVRLDLPRPPAGLAHVNATPALLAADLGGGLSRALAVRDRAFRMGEDRARSRLPRDSAIRLEHHIARSDASLDAGRGERVKLQSVAQHLEKARLLLLHVEIRSCHFECHGISRLAQFLRQVAADQQEHMIEPAIGAQDLAAALGRLDQVLLVEIAEDRQVGDDLADAGKLGVGHGAVHGRHGDHHIDERGVMVQWLGHVDPPVIALRPKSGATVGNCVHRGKPPSAWKDWR